jgi:FixJ family two-component response regulator
MQEDNPFVFVVDDDRSIRESLSNLIRSAGLNVQTFGSAQAFLTSRRPDAPSCLVLDVQLPGLSGLDLQQELAKVNRQIPIIFTTGHGDIPMTVRAMKAGAIEFLTKPCRDDDLLNAVEQAIHRGRQIEHLKNKPAEEKPYSEDELCSEVGFSEIVGKSAALRRVLQAVETVAPTEATVLLSGETGTGKEVIARCPPDRRHERGPGAAGRRETLSQRPLLPAARLPHRDPSVARAAGRHSPPRAVLCAQICAPHEPTD